MMYPERRRRAVSVGHHCSSGRPSTETSLNIIICIPGIYLPSDPAHPYFIKVMSYNKTPLILTGNHNQ